MPTNSTALMPIDPALSARQATRLLPIRANLLPTEITAGRNARRTRLVLAGAVLLVVVLLGVWFLYALQQKSDADADLAAATEQIQAVQKRKSGYRGLTAAISQQEAIAGQLKTLLKDDLPWASTLDTVRNSGTRAGATVTQMTGSLVGMDNAGTTAGAVAILSISGSAPDKKTVANFVDALATLDGIANPYLTSATQDKGGVQFSLTAELTAEALCGRHTTPCPTGGN